MSNNRIINQHRGRKSDKSADYRPGEAHKTHIAEYARARSALISRRRELFFSLSLGGASGGGGAHKSICNFFQQRQQQALCLHTRTLPAHTHTPGVSHATESREADYCAITHLVVRNSSAPLSLITNEQRESAALCDFRARDAALAAFFSDNAKLMGIFMLSNGNSSAKVA
jgi:hypothetical protein